MTYSELTAFKELKLSNSYRWLKFPITCCNFNTFKYHVFAPMGRFQKPRHPFLQKLSTFNSLIHRLINLPITKLNYKKELRYIEEMAAKNGFNLKTIHKLIRKQKSKQNKITALSKIETSKPKQMDNTHIHRRWINKTSKNTQKNR